MKTLKTIILLAAAVCLCSCLNDFLEAKTESSFTDEAVFSDPTLATGAVMGIYESINFNSFNGRLWAYHGYNNDTERHLSSTSGVTPRTTAIRPTPSTNTARRTTISATPSPMP